MYVCIRDRGGERDDNLYPTQKLFHIYLVAINVDYYMLYCN